MLDADADIGRRAWVPCTACGARDECVPCLRRRTCDRHWCYLLDSRTRWVFVQCAHCHHRWWHDTRFGVGDRPPDLDELPAFPTHASEGDLRSAS